MDMNWQNAVDQTVFPQNVYSEALSTSVTLFGDRACEVVIKIKWGLDPTSNAKKIKIKIKDEWKEIY